VASIASADGPDRHLHPVERGADRRISAQPSTLTTLQDHEGWSPISPSPPAQVVQPSSTRAYSIAER